MDKFVDRRLYVIGGGISGLFLISYILQISFFTLVLFTLFCGTLIAAVILRWRSPDNVVSFENKTSHMQNHRLDSTSSRLADAAADGENFNPVPHRTGQNKQHGSSFSRSPIQINRRPRFQSPAGPLLHSPLSALHTPANSPISPVSVSAKRYNFSSTEQPTVLPHVEFTSPRYTLVPNRKYPTHQPQYSSLGFLPPVKWRGGNSFKDTLSPLSPLARNKIASPVTVKIASVRSPSPLLQSLRERCADDRKADPLNKETVLSALRESKKRSVRDQDEETSSIASSVEKDAKRRRYESSASSTSTFATASPNVSGRNSPMPNGGLTIPGRLFSGVKRPASQDSSDLHPGSSQKKTRNAIDSSYSSMRKVKKKSLEPESAQVKRKVTYDEESDASSSKTPRRKLSSLEKDPSEKDRDSSSVRDDSSDEEQEDKTTESAIKEKVSLKTPKEMAPRLLKKTNASLRKRVPVFSALTDKDLLVPPSPYRYTQDDVAEDRRRAAERVQQMMQAVEKAPQSNKGEGKTQDIKPELPFFSTPTVSKASVLSCSGLGLQTSTAATTTAAPATASVAASTTSSTAAMPSITVNAAKPSDKTAGSTVTTSTAVTGFASQPAVSQSNPLLTAGDRSKLGGLAQTASGQSGGLESILQSSKPGAAGSTAVDTAKSSSVTSGLFSFGGTAAGSAATTTAAPGSVGQKPVNLGVATTQPLSTGLAGIGSTLSSTSTATPSQLTSIAAPTATTSASVASFPSASNLSGVAGGINFQATSSAPTSSVTTVTTTSTAARSLFTAATSQNAPTSTAATSSAATGLLPGAVSADLFGQKPPSSAGFSVQAPASTASTASATQTSAAPAGGFTFGAPVKAETAATSSVLQTPFSNIGQTTAAPSATTVPAAATTAPSFTPVFGLPSQTTPSTAPGQSKMPAIGFSGQPSSTSNIGGFTYTLPSQTTQTATGTTKTSTANLAGGMNFTPGAQTAGISSAGLFPAATVTMTGTAQPASTAAGGGFSFNKPGNFTSSPFPGTAAATSAGPSTTTSATPLPGGFGSRPAAQTSLFGTAATSSAPAPATASGFAFGGSGSQPAFGAATAATQSLGAFGTTATTQSAFGASGLGTATTQSAFGGSTAAPFGGMTQTAGSGANAPSAFGGTSTSAFGGQQATGTSFGGQQQQQGGTGFGGQAPGFGTQSVSGFGGQQQQQQATTGFGTQPQTSAGFGTQQQTTAFGMQQQQQQQQQQTGAGFGTPAQQSAPFNFTGAASTESKPFAFGASSAAAAPSATSGFNFSAGGTSSPAFGQSTAAAPSGAPFSFTGGSTPTANPFTPGAAPSTPSIGGFSMGSSAVPNTQFSQTRAQRLKKARAKYAKPRQ